LGFSSFLRDFWLCRFREFFFSRAHHPRPVVLPFFSLTRAFRFGQCFAAPPQHLLWPGLVSNAYKSPPPSLREFFLTLPFLPRRLFFSKKSTHASIQGCVNTHTSLSHRYITPSPYLGRIFLQRLVFRAEEFPLFFKSCQLFSSPISREHLPPHQYASFSRKLVSQSFPPPLKYPINWTCNQ